MTIDRNITHWEGEDADGRKCCPDGHRASEAGPSERRARCEICDHPIYAHDFLGCAVMERDPRNLCACRAYRNGKRDYDAVPAPEPPEGRCCSHKHPPGNRCSPSCVCYGPAETPLADLLAAARELEGWRFTTASGEAFPHALDLLAVCLMSEKKTAVDHVLAINDAAAAFVVVLRTTLESEVSR